MANALQVPFLWTSTLGVGPMATLGWLDTPVPTLVGVGSLLPCCVILLQGWGWMWWQKAVAIAVTLGALTAYPLILGQESHVLVGYPIQPRYLLPLLVMLAGISLLPAADERLRFTRGQVVVLVTALSAAQSIALYYNIWRYTKGLQRPFEPLGGDGWWWTWPFLPDCGVAPRVGDLRRPGEPPACSHSLQGVHVTEMPSTMPESALGKPR